MAGHEEWGRINKIRVYLTKEDTVKIIRVSQKKNT
jgi:hypothetical protein